jgi:hypothetical protein
MKQNETHRQCEKCLAWVPKSWEPDSHTCPPFLEYLVAESKKKKSVPPSPI